MDTFRQLVMLTRNVHKAYKAAPIQLKRRYLALFWEKIVVEDKKIKEAVPTKAFQELLPVA